MDSITVPYLIFMYEPKTPEETAFQCWLLDNNDNLSKIFRLFDVDGKSKIELSATTFSDYYKFAMSPIFSRVTKKYDSEKTPFYVTFGVDIRSPDIKELLSTNTELQELIIKKLELFSSRQFDYTIFKNLKAFKLEQSQDNSIVPPVCELGWTFRKSKNSCTPYNMQRKVYSQ